MPWRVTVNKKNWLVLFGIIFAFFVIAVFAIWFRQKSNNNDVQGKLVFAATYNEGSKVDKIIISAKEGNVILRQKNSYWLVENGGNYFADFRLIHSFLSTVNNSMYMMKIPYDKNSFNDFDLQTPNKQNENGGMLIATYANDSKLDEVIVGKEAENKGYFYLRKNNDKTIWLVDGEFNLPTKPQSWLLTPVLSVPMDAIESITIAKNYIQRDNKNSYFFNEKGKRVYAEPLLKVLYALNIVDAVKQEPDGEPLRVVDVITFYGLEYVIKLYEINDKLWASINLTTTSLPMTQVKEYVAGNSFLYEGWMFEIAPSQAHVLRDFRLE